MVVYRIYMDREILDTWFCLKIGTVCNYSFHPVLYHHSGVFVFRHTPMVCPFYGDPFRFLESCQLKHMAFSLSANVSLSVNWLTSKNEMLKSFK